MRSVEHRFANHTRSILGAIRAESAPTPAAAHRTPDEPPRGPAPFVTISRKAGAGGWTLAQRVADRLNAVAPDACGVPWAAWDHELVEKVSKEHDIAEAMVDAIGDTSHAWVQDLLAGLAFTGDRRRPDEFIVYRRVAQTIRALARAGGAIIVGRGAVFITRDLPGGVHVRLVAPLRHRVEVMARKLGVTPQEAARWVNETDARREAFYRRYWPGKSLAPQTFTITLNTAGLGEDQMAAAIMALIPGLGQVAAHGPATGAGETSGHPAMGSAPSR